MKGAQVIRRLDLGHIIRPAQEAGTPLPRVEPIRGYLVQRPEGTILFDTGIGGADSDAGRWVDGHYRPHRRDLREALRADAGTGLDEVGVVVNCHLHFDHCGGNALLAGKPVLVQRKELELARGGDYTLPELVDFSGARYEELDGELEFWPGVWLIPTPGHTAGHQSLVVRESDGTVVLAGQAHDFASHFDSSHMAWKAGMEGYPPWLEKVLSFDPRRVLFAHDNSVWEPTSN
jgi:N-acyl homoserine lactone hydrolase